MNSLWRAIGLGGSGVPGFEFTWGNAPIENDGDDDAPLEPYTLANEAALPWTAKPGTRDEDHLPVTIFEFNAANASSVDCEMARNVLKKAKTLMLPGILRTYAAVEYKGIIYIATESAIPLRQVLHEKDSNGKTYLSYYYEDEGKVSTSDAISGERFKNALAYGLKAIATGLAGIHQHGQIHGNVCEDSVFVTSGGEWRLFGLELVSSVAEEHSLFRRLGPGQMTEVRGVGFGGVFPPNGGDISGNDNLVSAVDSWAIGCLIHRIYSTKATSSKSGGASEMRSFRGMPPTLQSCYITLIGQNPKLRMTTSKFLESCEFINNCEYVSILNDLERLALLDSVDRDACYRRLAEQINTFPVSACKHIVLQQLKKALTFGGGTATVLEPILKMGTRLSAAAFSKHVGPIVVSMYSSPDYLVRCRLLSEASQYARMIPTNLFNEKIFTSYASGFESRHADIRELTVRSLVHFAPLLSEARLTTDVPKYIQLLQQDREGPIRTNATICLSLISSYIPETIRGKTLVNGFGRMLKDPFVPSKLAALQSINNTISVYQPSQIAEQLLPALSPIAVEARSAEIREVAITAMEKMVAKLREAHKTMPQSEEELKALDTTTPSKPTSSSVASAKKDGAGGFFGSVKWDNAAPVGSSSPSMSMASSTGVAVPLFSQPTPVVRSIAPTTTTAAAPSVAAIAQWEDDDDLDFNDDEDESIKPVKATTSNNPPPPKQQFTDPTTASSSSPLSGGSSSTVQTTTLRKPMSLNSTTGSSSTLVRKPSAGGSLKLGGLSGTTSSTTAAPKRKLGLGSTISKGD